ncbi:MAG: PA14 domain-containing protein [Sedimentisphaerales bacterium]
MCKKLACLTFLVLMLVFACPNRLFAGTIWETRISNGNDDAEEDVAGGGIDLSSSDLELLDDGGLQVVGIRFVDIPIPKGAIIDEAYVEFTCVEGEEDANPAAFSSATNDITSRPRTTANTIWAPANWTEVGQKDKTTDLTAIVQEIIDLDGWASGNALALIISDDPDNPSKGIRCAEASNDPAGAPLLHIEYRGKYAMQPTPPDGSLYEDSSAVLSWLPGLNAVSHDVYFGDNLEDVRDGAGDTFQGNQAEIFFTVGVPGTPVPDGLVPGTTYYWRIDELEANGTKNVGPVWSFTVPSLKAYNHNPSDGAKFIPPDYDLQWTAGSGAKVHTVFFGDSFDEVNDAVAGISQAGTTYDPGPLELDKTYYWRVDEFDGAETHKGDVLSFTTLATYGTGLRGDYYTGTNFDKLVLTRIDPQIDFPWAGAEADPAVGAGNFSIRWIGDVTAQFTETYTFYTITDDGIRLWINGQLIIDNWTNHGDTEDTGKIDLVAGQYCNLVMEYFQAGGGSIMQLGWLSPSIEKQLIPTYVLWPPVKARDPIPADLAVNVNHTATLRWSPGEEAASHEVYFGTDADAVANATKASPEYKGSKALGDESYDPGKLLWDTTYYWRIDEVSDTSPDSPWTGAVWSFTTADYLVVDDFENYTDNDTAGEAVWQSWTDGFGVADNGAQVGYLMPPYAEQTIVHGGSQSMPLAYNNVDAVTNSEAVLTLTMARDWTEEGVAELSLWFRGDSANAAEPLYVAISNAGGAPAIAAYDNPSAATLDTWTKWVIPLQAFADQGIDLTSVDKIAIGLGTKAGMTTSGGSGTIYVDDIALYQPASL